MLSKVERFMERITTSLLVKEKIREKLRQGKIKKQLAFCLPKPDC